VERIILPDSTILIDYLQQRAASLIADMRVDEQRMRANLELTHGALFSQRLLLALIERGSSREEAYGIVQELAQRAWDEGIHLRELLAADPRVPADLDLDAVFDYEHYLHHVDEVLARLQQIA
jgi:adenylosuccinate lyase